MSILIKNATIVSDGRSFQGAVLIENQRIKSVYEGQVAAFLQADQVIDAKGMLLLPGVIDDHVHFREPGLTHKADMYSESRAAVAGGTTSFMDMPNVKPQTVTLRDLMWKRERAAEVSVANYAFYIGADNENLESLKRIDSSLYCGVKLFMGSSTGNMLVDDESLLARIFAEIPALIAVHCESEQVIKANIARYKAEYGEDLPLRFHPLIRNAEACYRSSAEAVALAEKYGTRLHIMHLTTERELSLLEDKPLSEKHITAEVCPHHLWFNDSAYEKYGTRVKCNPAIKSETDRLALIRALNTDRLDVVGTDHAPHLLSEKQGGALTAASGSPLIQFSLLMMLEKTFEKEITIEKVVEKMSHAPAALYGVKDRGHIRPGFFADLVLVDPSRTLTVTSDTVVSKCGWSPLEGTTFHHRIDSTFVNGTRVYHNGEILDTYRGKALEFNR